MRKVVVSLAMVGMGVAIGLLLGTPSRSTPDVAPSPAFAAVAGERGGQDLFGAYDVVPDWPKPLSQLPGHENWTWGTVTGIAAEHADRVFVLQRGELPSVPRPPFSRLPAIGPSFIFPVDHAPHRNASLSSMGDPSWSGRPGIDARWEHCILVVNAAGDIVETWTQWDSRRFRPRGLQVFQRRVAPGADTGHPKAAWRGRHALRAARRALVAAGQHAVRGRRLH
jgi:hypothetical protein